MLQQQSAFLQIVFSVVALSTLAPSATLAALPSLGQAGQYAIYGSSTEILINNNANVNGDVALGPLGTLNFTNGSTISGGLYHDAGSVLNVDAGSQILGGTHLIDPTPIDADAHAAAAAANAMHPTQFFNSIGNGLTIFGNGGLNVISVTTNILVTNGGTLTLQGNGSDEFLINVNGTMTLTGASAIQLLGVSPEQVLWNFVGEGSEVLFENSTGIGNILAIERDIRFEGGSNLGSLISNGDRIKIQGGTQITVIPEPATGMLIMASLSMLFIRRRQIA